MFEAARKNLEGLAEFFTPAELRGDEQTQRQATQLVFVCANVVIWVPIFCAIYLFLFKETLSPHFMAACGLMAATAPWIFQKTGSISLSTNWMCFHFYWCIAAMSAVSGGLHAPSVLWFMIVPMAAGTINGWRAGIVWSTLSCGSVAGFYALETQSFVFLQVLTPEQISLLNALALCCVVIMMASNGLFVDRHQELAMAELKRANNALSGARDNAEAAGRTKDRFLATMSHEIRTPMNAVLGTAGLLIESGLSEDQRDLARTIQGSGETLLELLDGVLDFSRLESGDVRMAPEDFALSLALEEVLKPIRSRARDKGLQLGVEVGPGVPAALHGDPTRLKQVLAHLINNAVKFTASGQATISVRCDAREGKAVTLTFEVRDTGIGVDPRVQPHLFDAFTQADSSFTRAYDGLGLGLAISRKVVETMGGTIGYQPGAIIGSTFWFTLPFEERDLTRLPTQLPATPQERPAGLEARILVAEDNMVNQKLMTRMLEKLGYAFDIAENGAKAVRAFDTMPYDLVLMDCHMPEMDGFQATAEIRQLEPAGVHTPIIAVTANVMKGDRERCLAAGMDDYLPKPITLEMLSDALVRWSEVRAAG